MVLNQSKTINLFKKEKILLFDADITLGDENITRFLRKYDVQGIPFAIIYGKSNKEGKILPVVFSYEDLENAIIKTK